MKITREEQTKIESNGSISKEAIFAAEDHKIEKVEVPEWGGHLYVRNMNAIERDEYDRWVIDDKGNFDLIGMRLKLVIKTACNEKGVLMFEKDDYEKLSRCDGSAVVRIFMKSRILNGLDNAALDARVQALKNARPASLPSG